MNFGAEIPRTPARVGMGLDEVDTPALLLDLNAFEANLARLPTAVAGTGIRIRPHAKSHKCPEIALRQMALGAVGVCCQKVSEAEIFVRAGVPDVLVSNEIVGATKLARLAALAREARIGVCVDAAENVTELQMAAKRAGSLLDVYVEVNVGSNRCGVEPGAPVVSLAQAIARCDHLRFSGLQAYHGKAQHLRTPQERQTAIGGAVRHLQMTQELLAATGLPAEIVTGGGTGTYPLEAASRVFTEIQPGSYVFMDADYGRNLAGEGRPVDEFRQSLFILATVMSRSTPERAVVDVGLKAHSIDSGMPLVHGIAGASYVRAADEHGVIALEPGTPLELGRKIRLIPGHCDPTVNLHDWLVCFRHNHVEAVWPIAARGAFF